MPQRCGLPEVSNWGRSQKESRGVQLAVYLELMSARSPTPNNDCWLLDFFHLLIIGKIDILYSLCFWFYWFKHCSIRYLFLAWPVSFSESYPYVKTCKTTTFQASFFNRIVKPWNTICRLATSDKCSSLYISKNYLRATYFSLLDATFDINMPRTWILSPNCPCHRS